MAVPLYNIGQDFRGYEIIHTAVVSGCCLVIASNIIPFPARTYSNELRDPSVKDSKVDGM